MTSSDKPSPPSKGKGHKSKLKTQPVHHTSSPSSKKPKKKRAENAIWCMAEEAELVSILTEQKAAGNASDNGFKVTVWTLVVTALDELDDVVKKGPEKDVKSCKARYQRLRADYKIVKTLRELSGFGWDEGQQMVTASEDVWDKYIKAHPKAGPFKRKPFPLFDGIAALCDDVIATGAGAFSAGAEEQSDGSSQSEDEDLGMGEDEGGEEREGSKSPDVEQATLVGGPASIRSSPAPLARGSKRAARDSGRKSDKRRRRSGADGLFAISSAMTSMAESLASGSTIASAALTSPERMTSAIVKAQEEISDEDEALQAVSLFQRDPKLTTTYMALKNKTMRAKWLTRELDAAAAETAMAAREAMNSMNSMFQM